MLRAKPKVKRNYAKERKYDAKPDRDWETSPT